MLGLSGVIFFLSQFFQLVGGLHPDEGGARRVVRRCRSRRIRCGGRRRCALLAATGGPTSRLALVGVAMASLTLISPSTAHPRLGIALFGVGVGLLARSTPWPTT